MRLLFRLLLLIAATLLANAAMAGAATYCVMKPGCPGTPKPSLQEALDAALAAGPDRIEIGPTAGTPAAGGTYLSSDPLEIQGAGSAATQLAGGGSVLTLGQGYSSSSVSVSDLRIVLQGGSGATGLRLDGARAQRLDVTGDPSVAGAVGVELRNGAVFQHGTIALPAANAVGVWTRLGTSRIDDVVVDLGSAPGGRGLLAENPGGETPVILDAQHMTVAGGARGQVGAAANAVSSGQTVVLNLRNSILSGVGHALSRSAPGGSVNINPTYSNLDPAGNVDAGGVGGITPSPTNTNLNPAFVNAAAHDYRLSPVSPLIDAAQPGNLEPGDPTVDLAGTRRVLDGSGDCSPRRDMGAFEVLPGTVTARAAAGPQVVTVNQRITFDASASCDPDPAAAVNGYSWSFDEGGPATGAVVPRSFAKPGVHSATLTVTSSGGRRGSTAVTVTVNPRSRKPRRPRKPRRSFVLIQTRAVTLSPSGVALIPLRCAGTRRCKGRLYLTAARPASQSVGRLIMKLGSTTFAIPSNRTRKVRIRLTPARLALIGELGRLRTVVTVRDRDSAGRPRRSTRTIVLKALRR
jgi:PKD domain-containing protein